MATDTPTDSPTPEEPVDDIFEPEKKQRSPLERAIVWVLILGLLGVVGIEFRAQKGYAAAVSSLDEFYRKTPDAELKLAEVHKFMKYSPSVVGPTSMKDQQRRDVYVFSWLSIFKSGQFVITVEAEQGEDPYIFSFRTPQAEKKEPAVAKRDAGSDGDSRFGLSREMGSMTEFPSGGDFQGGGNFGGNNVPRVDPLLQFLDKDADNELSEEEIENAAFVLQGLDTNEDGELTADEITRQSGSGGPVLNDRPVLE
jgi:hypothetical protein